MKNDFKDSIKIKIQDNNNLLQKNGFKNLPNNIQSFINVTSPLSVSDLPKNLTVGNSQDTIKKCLLQGNVQNSGYEIGLLYLPVGTGIALHNHTTDGEKYMIISNNTFKIVGDEYFSTENICLPGESHGIEPVKEDTIILNIKVAKDLLNEIDLKTITHENIFSTDVQHHLLNLSTQCQVNQLSK